MQDQMRKWLDSVCSIKVVRTEPLVGDAGTRGYYRVFTEAGTFIGVHAPPDTEKVKEFIQLAAKFKLVGVLVPEIIAVDEAHGYFLVTDFGDRELVKVLTLGNADRYYQAALETALVIHQTRDAMHVNRDFLGGDLFWRELNGFVDDYLCELCGVALSEDARGMLSDVFSKIIVCANEQPEVCCHRDYHARNLMVLPDDRLGVIDFQDAMRGPITYDLVSLLRDCYVAWDSADVSLWRSAYYYMACEARLLRDVSVQTFERWFDWIGIQRHMKAIATFARKSLRDGDDRYLCYIPQALTYLNEASAKYDEFHQFHQFIVSQQERKGVPL